MMAIVGLASAVAMAPAQAVAASPFHTLHGTVEGDGVGQPGYQVSLYASYVTGLRHDRVLGTATTDDAGAFEIHYWLPVWIPSWFQPLLFVIAEDGPVMLASAIGKGPNDGDVVVNERTTVATGTAFAQFVDGARIRGNTYGMLNAVMIAATMADPETGDVGDVLFMSPNGTETSTYPTFNTLANIVAACVVDDSNCTTLFGAALPPGGPAPTTVLQAVANMTRYPAENIPTLFDLSLETPFYSPALGDEPTSWLLFLKFTGGFYSDYAATNLMNGPGNVAIDRRGFLWVNDNYVPVDPPPEDFDVDAFLADLPPVLPDFIACAGKRLLRFFPWGQANAIYFGGGLSGAGFGITLTPFGNVAVGNFGFEAPACANYPSVAAPHDSLSLFRPNGQPISGADGFTTGHIWWPQATVSDRKGNIWLANCGNDTVTFVPLGIPLLARNIPLPGGLGEQETYTPTDQSPLIKPFGIAIDLDGRAWVTGSKASEIYVVSPDGTVETVDSSAVALSWPMGISADSKGNMWVSSSDAVDVPCVDPLNRQSGPNPSVIFYPADGGAPVQTTNMGGLTIPWGNAVDGDDTFWVFNFGTSFDQDLAEVDYPDTPLSRFCGTGDCPGSLILGDAISPVTGYTSDALDRVTGGAIAPSGAIVLLNNWQKQGPSPLFYNTSPGGNSIVIVPGAAAPIKTPLIGPPQSFADDPDLASSLHLPNAWDRP